MKVLTKKCLGHFCYTASPLHKNAQNLSVRFFMEIGTFLQLISACIGIIGSIFFAQGIMRQSISSMADVSSSYWDSNPHMVITMAAQKADYLFGGGLIMLAFSTQLLSFLLPAELKVFAPEYSKHIPWYAAACAVLFFVFFRMLAKTLKGFYQRQIESELQRREEEYQEARRERVKLKNKT